MCYSGKCKLEAFGSGECNVKGSPAPGENRYRQILDAYGVSACYIGGYPYLSGDEIPDESLKKTPEELETIRKELKEKEWIF
jgi:hypothetical protein